jgi:hypothetical protein
MQQMERRSWRGRRRGRSRIVRVAEAAILFAVALIVTTTAAPQLLAWPYSAEIGRTRIYSERPIPPQMRAVLARSDALLARSPLADRGLERSLFLTDGGWRCDLLALTSSGAFALRRPFRDAIVVNASDAAADRVENGAPVGGVRSLSGVIAHETTHVLVAHHLGEIGAFMLPTWKSEGYADYVANESSLSDGDYARLHANGASRPAMFYYEARRRVDAALRRNGGNVDAFLQ